MMELPNRPEALETDVVAAWSCPVTIPTYPVGVPDRNPMFLERRVFQGSSGRVYPNPITDRVLDEKHERSWQAVHLENDYVRLMILPELGGRVHVGMDRTNGYDFFYRQNVIKPALVGLLGPWISGGVEFNWPQHHRPSSMMPLDWSIERLPDGGRTVWCSEHEPMGRTKGMHGVTLRPGSSLVEVRVRLFNRTPEVRTFLWWANVAARVHDQYQSFFPPDVHYVFDHARRGVSEFPIARGVYYGVDYGSRPPGDADLRWYRNIPVPTSYMAAGTRDDFFGGYDYSADSGFVHWADHRVAPGKKQWTWGSGDFGKAWDRELTDSDGPYVELMAGVYTDNQPDFSFLAPYETKVFSQYWYPIRHIGPARTATLDGALSLSVAQGHAKIGVAVTRPHGAVHIRVLSGEAVVWEHTQSLSPDLPLVVGAIAVPEGASENSLTVVVDARGVELMAWRPSPRKPASEPAPAPPAPASEPLEPASVGCVEELYLIGLHLQQYRHATRRPEDYWSEALRREPGDYRSNTAMGWWHLDRGEVAAALSFFRAAVATLTRLNPNPYDREAFYGLGTALRWAGQPEEADEALAKAAWSAAWAGPANFARAQLAARHGELESAVELLGRVLAVDSQQTMARGLRASMLRRRGARYEAATQVAAVLRADPLDALALNERLLLCEAGTMCELDATACLPSVGAPLPGGCQTVLDVALDYAAIGFFQEAIEVLRRLPSERVAADPMAATPMVFYTIAWLLDQSGDPENAQLERERAARMSADYCFPSRLQEIFILEETIKTCPTDPRAPYYLGCVLYDRRRYGEAIKQWQDAERLDPDFPTTLRNLGLAQFNVLGHPDEALGYYERAFCASASDARILYELDQLRKRCGQDPDRRAVALEQHLELVGRRDDLTVEYVTLLNEIGRHEDALEVIGRRRFHPWEGGEGLVSAQWVLTNLRLAQIALEADDPTGAIQRLEAALERPANLGEGKHLLTPENEVEYWLGVALWSSGRHDEARSRWESAASFEGDPGRPIGEPCYWQARALRALGEDEAASALLTQLRESAGQRASRAEPIDYFATSLPSLLLFDDDLEARRRLECRYLESLADAGLGEADAARAGFAEVLAGDVDHVGAAWHLRVLDARC